MPRYAIGASKLRSYHWEDEDEPNRIFVDVDEFVPADTGLITLAGEPIMRLPNPIGFGRDEDW